MEIVLLVLTFPEIWSFNFNFWIAGWQMNTLPPSIHCWFCFSSSLATSSSASGSRCVSQEFSTAPEGKDSFVLAENWKAIFRISSDFPAELSMIDSHPRVDGDGGVEERIISGRRFIVIRFIINPITRTTLWLHYIVLRLAKCVNARVMPLYSTSRGY